MTHDEGGNNRLQRSFSGISLSSGDGRDDGGRRILALEFEVRNLRRDVNELSKKMDSFSSDLMDIKMSIRELKTALDYLPTWKSVIYMFILFVGALAALATVPVWPQLVSSVTTAITDNDAANSRTTPGSPDARAPRQPR